MKSAIEMHETAMDLAQKGLSAKRRGDERGRVRYLKRALSSSLQAVDAALSSHATVTDRGIILHSAAMLALDVGSFEAAEKVCYKALGGTLGEALDSSFRHLLEKASLHRHLADIGKGLGEGEMDMVLTGDEASAGCLRQGLLSCRVVALEGISRTVGQHLSGHPCRRAGRLPTSDRHSFDLYYLAGSGDGPQNFARRSSFAARLHLGAPVRQTDLLVEPSAILAEVADCIELFEDEKLEELRRKLGDGYFDRFLTYAREIQPDGAGVRAVSLAAEVGGGVRKVSLLRPRIRRSSMAAETNVAGVSVHMPLSEDVADAISVVGLLKSAKVLGKARTRSDEWQIVIEDDEGVSSTFLISADFCDSVRNYFGLRVQASGLSRGSKATLTEIVEADS